MKKLLIATSAVVGLGLVSADFAAAQLETSFSGLVRIRAINSGLTGEETALATNLTRLTWGATGTSDSGLTYGAQVRWENADTVAKSNIFFGGGFGTVTLGVSDPAKSSVGAGIGGALDGRVTTGVSGPNVTGNSGGTDRIVYVSPSFGGVTFAADYYSANGEGAASGMSAGVKYSGSMDDVSFNVAAGVHRGDIDLTGADSVEGMGIAADVTMGAVTIGANYMDTTDVAYTAGTAGVAQIQAVDAAGAVIANTFVPAVAAVAASATTTEAKTLLVSAKFNFGPGSANIGYGRKTPGTGDSNSVVVAGLDYTVAPGWSVYAEVARQSSDDSNTNWVLGTDVAF